MSELAIQLPAHADQDAFNLSRWAEILDDPFYAGLEQRIETDRHGNLLMFPPPSFSHGRKGFSEEAIRFSDVPGAQSARTAVTSTTGAVCFQARFPRKIAAMLRPALRPHHMPAGPIWREKAR